MAQRGEVLSGVGVRTSCLGFGAVSKDAWIGTVEIEGGKYVVDLTSLYHLPSSSSQYLIKFSSPCVKRKADKRATQTINPPEKTFIDQ